MWTICLMPWTPISIGKSPNLNFPAISNLANFLIFRHMHLETARKRTLVSQGGYLELESNDKALDEFDEQFTSLQSESDLKVKR